MLVRKGREGKPETCCLKLLNLRMSYYEMPIGNSFLSPQWFSLLICNIRPVWQNLATICKGRRSVEGPKNLLLWNPPQCTRHCAEMQRTTGAKTVRGRTGSYPSYNLSFHCQQNHTRSVSVFMNLLLYEWSSGKRPNFTSWLLQSLTGWLRSRHLAFQNLRFLLWKLGLGIPTVSTLWTQSQSLGMLGRKSFIYKLKRAL